MTEESTVPVRLPEELYARLQRRIQGSAFPSVDAFLGFVVARLLEADATAGEPLSAEDERRVAERLRALGYLD
jgi:Arc/MetJ-type ribon-helix-helix transcriptional regulator